MSDSKVTPIVRARIKRLIRQVRPNCPREEVEQVTAQFEGMIDQAVANALAEETKKTAK